MWRRLKASLLAERIPVSHGGVVGQVWRGAGPRQARLSKALEGIDVRPLDERLGRSAGELLGRAGRTDVIDAAVVLLAEDGDQIVTTDVDDLRPLAVLVDRQIELIGA